MECSVCFENCDDCVITQCNHTFCKLCITTWKSVQNTCPLCRQNLIIRVIKRDEVNKRDEVINTSQIIKEEYIPTIRYARAVHSTPPDSLDQINTKFIMLVWNIEQINAATTYASQKLKDNENVIIYLTRNTLSESQIKELEIIHNCPKIVYYNF